MPRPPIDDYVLHLLDCRVFRANEFQETGMGSADWPRRLRTSSRTRCRVGVSWSDRTQPTCGPGNHAAAGNAVDPDRRAERFANAVA
jgi:hypothetical protein